MIDASLWFHFHKKVYLKKMENTAEIIAITLREALRSRLFIHSFFRSIRLSVILILLIFIFHSWHKNENCVCVVMTERGKGILRSKEMAPAPKQKT